MKRHALIHRPSQRAKTQRGFTLLELLVVIGLIIFLVSMTIAVVSGVIGGAREKGTKATIRKVDGLLSQRMEAFTMWLQSRSLDGNDFSDVIERKRQMRLGFPQNIVEAGIANALPTTIDETESSEMLYEFLTNGTSYGPAPVDSSSFDSNEVADTDGDGRMEFVDRWGRPLRFYRWPTRLIRPGDPTPSTAQTIDSTSGDYAIDAIDSPTEPYYTEAGHNAAIFFASMPGTEAELEKDPQDPLGRISAGSFNTTNFKLSDFERNYHTPETWSLPLIVSAGPDGVLGLYEPTDKGNFGHLAQPRNDSQMEGMLDNLSNRNMEP